MKTHDHSAKKPSDSSKHEKELIRHKTSSSNSFDAMHRATQKPNTETLTPDSIMQLQRTIGNHAVTKLLQRYSETTINNNILSHNYAHKIAISNNKIAPQFIQRANTITYINSDDDLARVTAVHLGTNTNTLVAHDNISATLSDMDDNDTLYIIAHGYEILPRINQIANQIMYEQDDDHNVRMERPRIVLFSCQMGATLDGQLQSTAQQLANLVGRAVFASTANVSVDEVESGTMQGDDPMLVGNWNEYNPQTEEEETEEQIDTLGNMLSNLNLE